MTSALAPLGENLWIADGPVISFLGFPYTTRMAIVRLTGGDLFVWSPISLSSALQAEVEALGTVKHLVSPNKLHHLSLQDWRRAFPQSCLYASPGLAKKRRDIAFDAALGDLPAPAWAEEIDQVAMAGSFAMTEIVFFHRASRTVLFADLIESFPRDWFKGWRSLVARADGIVMPDAGAPREWRLTFVDRKAARVALGRILAWPAERVVVAHGEIVREGGSDFIRNSFRWLG